MAALMMTESGIGFYDGERIYTVAARFMITYQETDEPPVRPAARPIREALRRPMTNGPAAARANWLGRRRCVAPWRRGAVARGRRREPISPSDSPPTEPQLIRHLGPHDDRLELSGAIERPMNWASGEPLKVRADTEYPDGRHDDVNTVLSW